MTVHFSPPALPECVEPFALWRAQYSKFRALLDDGAPAFKALRYLGLALWQDGRLDDAANVLIATANLAPNDPAILGELGSVLCAAGRKTEAMRYLIASLELDPGQLQVWLNVAGLCNEIGDRNTAEHAFRAALELDPDSAEASAGLGLVYIESRRLEDAARLLGAAVERGVTAIPVYACLGQTLFLLGDFANATVALEKAALAYPSEPGIVRKYAQARLIEAVINNSANSVEEAIEIYRSAAGPHAEDTTVACRAAFQTLCGYGRRDAAIRLGQALLETAPNDPIVGYHLDALRGAAHDRAPHSYLVACFDKYAPNFDRHLVEVLDYRIPDKLHPLLVATGQTFSRALDLGCGTGLAAKILASVAGDLTGVDISPRMLDKARERNLYDRLIEEDAVAYLSRRQELFDLIVSLDVLVYFGDLTELFAAVAARLSSGGVFAFSFETGPGPSYDLLPSGRFAHDPGYIESLWQARFACIASLPTTIRLEANRSVAGRLVLLRRA